MLKTHLLRVAWLLVLTVLIASCKKGQKECNLSGIITPNTYVFWVPQDFGCGYINVEVKDKGGYVVSSFYTEIKVRDASAPDCATVNKSSHGVFSLSPGETYAYRATCTGRTWSGKIDVPCEQGQCKTIKLE